MALQRTADDAVAIMKTRINAAGHCRDDEQAHHGDRPADGLLRPRALHPLLPLRRASPTYRDERKQAVALTAPQSCRSSAARWFPWESAAPSRWRRCHARRRGMTSLRMRNDAALIAVAVAAHGVDDAHVEIAAADLDRRRAASAAPMTGSTMEEARR